MRYARVASLFFAAALFGACDGGGTNTDGGVDDGGNAGDDGGGGSGDGGGGGGNVSTCDSPRVITLTTGTQTIRGDTTGGGSPLDLGSNCRSEDPAPQDVIALTLPGSASETYRVRFDFAQAGTAAAFDTLVQVRETCDDPEGLLCFDDGTDFRSAGEFAATGGSTRFLIVTGYAPPYRAGNVFEGPYEASVEVTGPMSPPVLTGATVLNVAGEELRFTLMGSDADMDANGMRLQFLDASGEVIGIDDDGDPGTPPAEAFPFGLDGVAGEATFTASTVIGIEGVTELESATQVRIELIDVLALRSAPMDVPLTLGAWAGLGETCDDTHLCTVGLECTADACALPADVAAACDAATSFALTTESSSTVVTVPAGEGLLSGSCALTPFGDGTVGAEVLVQVTGMPGHDIVLATEGATTMTTDTVLYAMGTCGDPGSEVACNDDIPSDADPVPRHSLLEILDTTATTYTVAVELFGGTDTPTMVDLVGRLRPVLATGAACDPAGVMNRCSAGPCPSDGEALCP